MDKYEYKVRAEEIDKLIKERDYQRAVEIADTIDWRRAKSVKTLCVISDLYKINRRYQESKEILLMAYKLYPSGRRIVYSLCELSIRLDEYVQAIEYYKEYVQLAPKDPSRYILQYKLYEANDVPLDERVEVLEEFKRKDYREKWAYELAYLYHRMGLGAKCVDECEEMIVAFGEGNYVIKAMELKMQHQPLTATEQAKYDAWQAETAEAAADVEERIVPKDTAEISGSLDTQDLTVDSTGQMPEEINIEVKTVDVGQYNTTNLQEALAESMKDIFGEEEPALEEEKPSTPEENVDDNTIYSASPLAGPMYASTNSEIAPEKWDTNPDLPYGEQLEEQVIVQHEELITDNDVADPFSGETKRIPTEAVAKYMENSEVDYVEAKKVVNSFKQDTASFAAARVEMDRIMNSMSSAGHDDSAYDNMLAQESDGQIRLAMPDTDQIEKQITGQLSIEDIMAEWEQTKKANEEKRRQEVKQRILQHTGSLFDEFDEATKAGILDQLEKAFHDVIDKEARNGNIDSEDLDKKINAEARRAVEYLTRDGLKDENVDEIEDAPKTTEEVNAEAEDNVDVEEAEDAACEADNQEEASEEIEITDNSEAGEADEAQDEDKESQSDEESDEIPEVEDDSEEVKAVMKALADDEEDMSEDASEEGDESGQNHERGLSEDEEEFFAPYLTRRSTRRQIAAAIENMSLASYTGNVIVTGEEGVGTLDLAKRLIKQLQMADANLVGQKAMVSGKALNEKDIDATIEQLDGGALVIQTARGMKKSTVEKLMKALDKEECGILVILEDTAEGMDRIQKALPDLAKFFNSRIDLHALDDKALVSYAKEYALSQEYSIDEFGILALHTRISEMQTNDHQVTVAEIRDLVDDAIYFAEKKTPAHFFDVIFHKRYDEDDMVVLREKDFMHY